MTFVRGYHQTTQGEYACDVCGRTGVEIGHISHRSGCAVQRAESAERQLADLEGEVDRWHGRTLAAERQLAEARDLLAEAVNVIAGIERHVDRAAFADRIMRWLAGRGE